MASSVPLPSTNITRLSPGLDAAEDGLGASAEAKNSSSLQQPPLVFGTDKGATAGGNNLPGAFTEVRYHFPFHFPESGLPILLKNTVYRLSGSSHNAIIGVHQWPTGTARQYPTHTGLSRTHEAHQDDVPNAIHGPLTFVQCSIWEAIHAEVGRLFILVRRETKVKKV